MSEHLVALCYILLIAAGSFFVIAKPMTAQLMAPADFARRRNLWFAVTVITFLSHSFWLALLLSGVAIAIGSRRESNPVAMYCALLFAVPQFDMRVPAFGLVNWLFEINHHRAMALVLLLPAALRLAVEPHPPNSRLRIADTLFLAYFTYVFVLSATALQLTDLMRLVVDLTLDHGLLYYVVSRSINNRQRLLDVLASFTLALAIVGVVGAFETVRHWLVYESLRGPLGIPAQTLGSYLMRETDDGGYLRAYVSAGHAIALGFMAMIAVTFQLALMRRYQPKWLGWAVVALLLAGLAASVSRGPWLACAIAMVLGLAFGEGAKQRVAWMAALVPVAILVLLVHPQGQKVIDLLPFIGSVEKGSVTYRTQLIDTAMIVFWQNPIFGSLQYINNPVMESMRQGQGIIDIVNSYLGVALAYGAVGLLLFIAPAAYSLVGCIATSRRLARSDPDAEAAGRALAAAMIAMLLAIGAVSFYFHIPTVFWMVIGLGVAYAAHAPAWRRAAVRPQPVQPGATRRPAPALRGRPLA